MEKIIFFGLAVPILGFVFYLGGSAIMKGFKAKVDFAPKKNQDEGSDQSQSELDTGATNTNDTVSYTHLRAHETDSYLVCRLLLEKKKF